MMIASNTSARRPFARAPGRGRAAALAAVAVSIIAVEGVSASGPAAAIRAGWNSQTEQAPPESPTAAPSEETAALRGMIADLQRQVDELKGAASAQWLTQRRADEIRGIVHEVLADADTRASLLQTGVTAGWDNGFFIGSADGNHLLRIAGQMQVRAVYNRQESSPTDDSRFGFESRRTKLYFRGHVFDPSWTYSVEVDSNRSGGAFALGENGWIQKDLGNGMKIRAGQFKPMFLREESISSGRLLTIERSLFNAEFTAGTAQGAQLQWDAGENWRIFGAFIDGVATANTPALMEDTEFAFTGRSEWILAGDWRAVEDDIGFRNADPAVMVGVGVLYQREEFGTGSNLPPPDFNNAETDNFSLTADLTWKQHGASAAAAIVYRRLDNDAMSDALDQVGIVLRGGLFVRDDTEVYVQYEWGDLDMAGVEDLSVITVGVTRYWNRHDIKWQNDIGFGLNEVASAWAADSAGWRADAPGEDGQIVVRSQLQLLF